MLLDVLLGLLLWLSLDAVAGASLPLLSDGFELLPNFTLQKAQVRCLSSTVKITPEG